MRIGLAALLLAWVLLLSLATVSPDLHNRLHLFEADTCEGHCHSEHSNENDAEDTTPADHVCAVTLFAAGLDYDIPPSLPDVGFLPIGNIDDPESLSPLIVHRSLLYARAPPVVAI